MYDMIIKNGTVLDGTGDDRYVADIAIKDGKIGPIYQKLLSLYQRYVRKHYLP